MTVLILLFTISYGQGSILELWTTKDRNLKKLYTVGSRDTTGVSVDVGNLGHDLVTGGDVDGDGDGVR